MSDMPWEIKKGAEKESPEDTPSAVEFPWEKDESAEGGDETPASGGVPDMFADAFADIPMEEVGDPEIPGQPDSFVMPSLDEIPDFLKSVPGEEETSDVNPPEPSLQPPSLPEMPNLEEVGAPPFDMDSQVITVHAVDQEKPPEISVMDGLSESMQGDTPNEKDGVIPSFKDVSGFDANAEDKMDLQKHTPPPLFEPKLSQDEDVAVDDVNGSIELPKMAPSFEVYGQEPPEVDSVDDEVETASPFPPTSDSVPPSPFPPTPESDPSSPFPPTPESEPSSPFSPTSESDPSSPFPPTPDSEAPFPSQTIASNSLAKGTTKKTMDGIVASLKNVLKSLTRGGSLIDRMDELREEVEIAEGERIGEESDMVSTPEPSPFELTPKPSPFEEVSEMVGQPISVPQPEMEKIEVKEPEPEMAVAEPVDELHKDEMRELVGGLSKDEVQALVGKQIKEAFENHAEPVTPVESVVSDMDTNVDDLRNEVENSKGLIDEIVNNIKELSSTVESSTVTMNEIKSYAENFDSDVSLGFDSAREKISGIENRLDVVENTLTLIQSENADTKAGLSNIEQNISDLVGSYSALLSQMYESAQSSDVKFEELTGKMDRIDLIDSNISHIENNQAIAAETIAEFGNTTSILMSDIAEAYEANETLKDETKSDNAELREEMALITEYVEKGLKKVGAGSYRSFGQDVELVHLEKNSSTMKLCMEWLEFLMELVGRNNLPDILSYYEELGWVSDDVRLELMRYAEGIDYYLEKPDWKLNPDEHVKSIWFIEKLAGVKVDKNRLSIIERDIERVKKGTEIYGI
jgi:archaellum component FlaD/FlaE